MSSFKIKSEGVNMVAIKNVINSFSVKSASILLIGVWIAFSLGCSADGSGNTTFNTPATGSWLPVTDTLERISPEKAGWSSAELQEAHRFAIQSGCQAVMALYDGKVFFSRGNTHKNYGVGSIRETFLSALYGIHFARGNINLNATLADLHIDDITPGLTQAEKQAEVLHLLMSRSGVYHEAAAEDQKLIDTRPGRGSHPPDTFFYHNNWDVNALGTIFEQETGEEIFKAFKKEIADVVEMVDFSIGNGFYDYEWNKSLHSAYHFKMSARDMAKFGVLYQKNGKWEGSQIILSAWMDESTMDYSTMDQTTGVGYGYMWKIIPEDSEMGQVIGYPGYYHTGAGGDVLVIIPDLKLVIVERYDTDQNWDEPGADGFELAMLILDAHLAE
jgi:CubicO group peptidase (beta-lactamase class C family)